MKLSTKALHLLNKINSTEDGSIRGRPGQGKAAQELINNGLIVLVPISTGGSDICLTTKGIEYMDHLENPQGIPFHD